MTQQLRQNLWQPFTVIAGLQQELEQQGALEYKRERVPPETYEHIRVLPTGDEIWEGDFPIGVEVETDAVRLKARCYHEKLRYWGKPNQWEIKVYPMWMGVLHKAQVIVWWMDKPHTTIAHLAPDS